jgi:phage FluMu protein Com
MTSSNLIEITCSRCDHTWYVDLSNLDEEDLIIYKDEAQRKTYRAKCPNCGTYNVFTVEFEEERRER